MAITSLPRRALFRVLPELFRVTIPMERHLTASYDPDQPVAPPPLLLVGAPRTGSTVTYQLITNRLLVDYPSNLAALFYHSLYVGLALQEAVYSSRPHGSLRSEHGRTPGLDGPHQLAEFWYRWFPRDPTFVPGDLIRPQEFADLRRTLGAIARRSGRPFVVKNLNNGQRLQAFHRFLPEALFVFCRRDPLETAASILEARKRVFGDPSVWWGVAPRNVDELRKLPYPEQIVRQVYFVEKQIEQDLTLYPERQHLVLRLDDLRADPERVVGLVREFLMANGVEVRTRDRTETPRNAVKPHRESARAGAFRDVTPQEYEALRRAVEALQW